MDRRSRIRISIGAIVVIALGTFLYLQRHPRARHLDLEPGTIYYKGPMKSKGGDTYGVDDLNPDILGDVAPTR